MFLPISLATLLGGKMYKYFPFISAVHKSINCLIMHHKYGQQFCQKRSHQSFLSFFLCWGLLLAPGGELFQPMSTSSRAEQGDESVQP